MNEAVDVTASLAVDDHVGFRLVGDDADPSGDLLIDPFVEEELFEQGGAGSGVLDVVDSDGVVKLCLFELEGLPGDDGKFGVERGGPFLIVNVEDVELLQKAVEDIFPGDDPLEDPPVVHHGETTVLVGLKLLHHIAQGVLFVEADHLGGHHVADRFAEAAELDGDDDVFNADDADQVLFLVDHGDSGDLVDPHQLLGQRDLLLRGQDDDVPGHDVGGFDVLEEFGVLGEFKFVAHPHL